MKMKREARDHGRAMKKLQKENEDMRKELDALGVVREAEKWVCLPCIALYFVMRVQSGLMRCRPYSLHCFLSLR